MTDDDNRRRVAPIVCNRLFSGRAPYQITLHARRNSGVTDAVGQTVDTARIDQSSDTAEQIGAAARGDAYRPDLLLSALTVKAGPRGRLVRRAHIAVFLTAICL